MTEDRVPPPLTDSEKLRGLALWFDLYDSDREKARIILDDVMPPKDEVQRDLRRIANQLEQPAPPRAEGLDVSQLFDPLSDEVGRFVARWVKPEQRADAIEDAFRLLKLAREYPFDRDWAGPPYTRHARLSRPSDERVPESEAPR